MPNHVRNVIRFNKDADNAKKIEALFESVLNTNEYGDQFFDFNKLILMPESLTIESSSRTDLGALLYKAILHANALPATDIERVLNAKKSEEVFSGKTEDEVTAEYRRLIKTLHPDVSSHPKANEATGKLIQFYVKAKDFISRDIWHPSFSLPEDGFFNVPGVESWAIKGLKNSIANEGINISEPDALQKFIETANGKEYYDLGKIAVTNEIDYGAATWYDWCCREWGTKWNSYDCTVDLEDGTISFSTAWSCPHPIVSKLAENHPNVYFEWEYADEDMGANTGFYSFSDNGLSSMFNDDGSNEAYQTYVNCWGVSDCLYRNGDGKWQRYDCDKCPNQC